MLGVVVTHVKAFVSLRKKLIASAVQSHKHADFFADKARMPKAPFLRGDIDPFFTGGKEFALEI